MPEILIAVSYGGYVSPVKLIIFLALFFGWLPLIKWVKEDTGFADLNETLWTGIVFGAGAFGFLVWLLMPNFILGIVFFLLAGGASTLSYVVTRNGKLPPSDKVLTPAHISRLLSKEGKKERGSEDFVFITTNGNEVPIPERKTTDYFGYTQAEEIFKDALWRRASDVILLPAQETYKVNYLVDGVALKQPDIEKDQAEYLISFLKKLAELNPEEKRKPQKGDFNIEHASENDKWKIQTAGSTAGEQVKLKKEEDKKLTKIENLNFTRDTEEKFKKIMQMDQGVVLITGPKQSGVSTTFYGLIRENDAFLNNINTLERNPTADLMNVTQNVFSLSDSGTSTFSDKLKEIGRMGADIIGVEGCDDSETAKTACNLALDEKVLYVTLQAESAVKALGKWIKLVGDKSLATKSLIGISNQRLLRRLCEDCKEAYEPNKNLLRKFNLPPEKASVLYRAGKYQYTRGGKPIPCETCQETGYVGRLPIVEIVLMDDNIRGDLKKAKSLKDISNIFRNARILYLQEVALKRVMEGETSINEMVRVLSAPKQKKKK